MEYKKIPEVLTVSSESVRNKNYRDVAQSGSAPEWGSGGRWFKSSRPDQFLKGLVGLEIGRISPFPFQRVRLGKGFKEEGIMKFCSFGCPKAENEKAQHAACLAINGVFCGALKRVVEKGTPCPMEKGREIKKSHRKKAGA
jgi:hypothetical protein